MTDISRLALRGLIIAITILIGVVSSAHADQAPARLRTIYTNDTIGYIEPCGCGGRYQGGLARRVTAVSELVRENPNALILDSGNLSSTPDRFRVICSVMARIGYDAVGVGRQDSLNLEEFVKQTSANRLKVIDALQPNSENVVPYMVKNIAGVRVGVVSFAGNLSASQAAPQAFVSAYKAAREASDVLVLLDQGGIAARKWLEGAGQEMGVPDLVIGGSARGVIAKEQVIGKTHILPTSQFGKQIGVADVALAADGSLQVTSKLVVVDKSVAEDESTKKQVEEFIQGIKSLATLTPSSLNFGTIKKGGRKTDYITLAPTGSSKLGIKKTTSTSKQIVAKDWTANPDGSYKVRVIIDAGKTTGRVLETVSIVLDLPGQPTLDLKVFGNVVDE